MYASDTLHPSTFSIVAWDPANGDLGVAVQSKFLAVGAVQFGLEAADVFKPGLDRIDIGTGKTIRTCRLSSQEKQRRHAEQDEESGPDFN